MLTTPCSLASGMMPVTRVWWPGSQSRIHLSTRPMDSWWRGSPTTSTSSWSPTELGPVTWAASRANWGSSNCTNTLETHFLFSGQNLILEMWYCFQNVLFTLHQELFIWFICFDSFQTYLVFLLREVLLGIKGGSILWSFLCLFWLSFKPRSHSFYRGQTIPGLQIGLASGSWITVTLLMDLCSPLWT